MAKFSDDVALVGAHLGEFQLVDEFLQGISLGGGMAPPNFAFDIVLEQHSWNRELGGKIYSGIKKIAYHNVEGFVFKPIIDSRLHFGRGEAAYGIGSGFQEVKQVAECSGRSVPATHTNGIGEMLPHVAFILGVRFAAVVREECQLLVGGEFPHNAKGANVSPGVHRQKLIGFNPEDSHLKSPEFQTGLRPVTKLVNATKAAA